jgi:hypothetical protein
VKIKNILSKVGVIMNKKIIELNQCEINMISGGGSNDTDTNTDDDILSDKFTAYLGVGVGAIIVMIGLIICLRAQSARPSPNHNTHVRLEEGEV